MGQQTGTSDSLDYPTFVHSVPQERASLALPAPVFEVMQDCRMAEDDQSFDISISFNQ